jgi:hypothetical protein
MTVYRVTDVGEIDPKRISNRFLYGRSQMRLLKAKRAVRIDCAYDGFDICDPDSFEKSDLVATDEITAEWRGEEWQVINAMPLLEKIHFILVQYG